MKPKRIQRKRTKGWRMPENTVYVGRGSKWGNPCKVVVEQDREHAVAWFQAHVVHTLDLEPLKGKNLACWCPLDKPCHADILLEEANK